MTFVAWSAVLVFIAAYPVAVYPLVVMAVAALRPRPWRRSEWIGSVAHVVTVHNEAARIARKLENALEIDAPGGGTEILVVDDGSTDGTENVVRRYAPRGVKWIGHPRLGKEAAQIAAIRATDCSVIVFSDASTQLKKGALCAVLTPFEDPDVAAVSGTDISEAGETGTGEDLYVRYEMAIRRSESQAGSLVGLSGCFFAVRREIAEQLLPDVPSDLGTALLCAISGRRAVSEADARCMYSNLSDANREFSRKRRTALRGLRCLWAYRRALSIRRPMISWQILSHKVARFLSPFFLALSLAVLLAGAVNGERLARWGAVAIGVAALVASASVLWPGLRRSFWIRALGFFVLSNGAVLAAWVDLISGRKLRTWAPTSRA